jgi:hypothetical protein
MSVRAKEANCCATTDEARGPRTQDVADTATDEVLPPIRWLTDEEWTAKVDPAARRHLGMSGEEFTRAWKAGEFDDNPDRPEVMRVAMLTWFDE